MATTPYSPAWYRAANLRPRLRRHTDIQRQVFRGQLWYVLQDHVSGRFHRFSPAVYFILGRFDGKRSLHELWEHARQRFGEEAPTQEEILRLLSQLHAADLLYSDVPPDLEELSHRGETIRRRQLLYRFRSPLAIRIPLLDPERFLASTMPLVRPLFSIAGLLLWLVVVGSAVLVAAEHWTDLTDNLVDRVLATENLIILWLTFPVIKCLHEFGHAYAVKRWGGEVHEMGIMFLVLTPIPYVDASSSTAFRTKWQRAFVGAAGMIVELFFASIALFLWMDMQPGVVRGILFNLMLIASVSTVVFNGNPLLRYDGYYVFADVLEIPNLAQRGQRYILYLIQRYIFGLQDAVTPVLLASERKWLAFHAVGSFCYRAVVATGIAIFIAQKYLIFGVVLAVWAYGQIVVLPILRGLKFILLEPAVRQRRARAVLSTAAFIGGVVASIFLVPVPLATMAEGVLWVPADSRINAGTDGLVERVVATPNSLVRKGDLLMLLSDAQLHKRVSVLEAKEAELGARHLEESVTDRVQAAMTQEQIGSIKEQLDEARQQEAKLQVRSSNAGRFILPDAADLPGKFVRRGDALGYVIANEQPVIRVVVPQEDADLVRSRIKDVKVRLAEDVRTVLAGHLTREVPGATSTLPSMALATVGGGTVALAPNSGVSPKALKDLFYFEVELPAGERFENYGERAYVRFGHGEEALAYQWYRRLRQMFLRRFNE
jgi:putative peptide zinc metalloprotease protein